MKNLLYLAILFISCETPCDKTIIFTNKQPTDILIYSIPLDCNGCLQRELIETISGYGTEVVPCNEDQIRIHAIYIGCCEWVKTFQTQECETEIVLN